MTDEKIPTNDTTLLVLGDASIGPLVAAGADHLARFGLDEVLEDETNGVTDEVCAIARLERGEQRGIGGYGSALSSRWAQPRSTGIMDGRR